MNLRRLGLCLALLLLLSPALVSAQPAAIITTIAGGGPADGSPALSAALFWPVRVAMVPGSSDFYVSVIESHRVYRVSAATGAITTIVGAGGAGYNGDNIPATSAQIAAPYGITVDQSTGDLYIADGGNHRIRKVTAATGLISTVAGGGYGGYFNGDNGPATSGDDTAHVVESNEANNCLASTTTIQITRPDLTETTLSAPPATVVRGTSSSVTDTVQNQGGLTADASTTRYFLSTRRVKDGSDRLIGSRSVPALEATQTSTAAATVTVPSNMTPGAYYLIAYADNTGNVTEIDETNNCLVSDTTVQVTAQ